MSEVMTKDQKMSFWQIWNMNFGFLGIQFGWGLQMANMSPIYEMLGAREDQLALLWIAAPLTGLLVQPIVGHMSDRTWNKLGRRNPYLLFGAIFSSLALIAMPNSSALWMAAGLLWILDGSVNVTMQPFRSLVADLLPEKRRAFGFSVQTVLTGIGAVVSSALPWMMMNWFGVSSESPEPGVLPDTIKYSFYIGAAVLLMAVVWTVMKTKEHPPKDMEAFKKKKEKSKGLAANTKEIFASISAMPDRMKQLAWVQMFTWAGLFCMWTYFSSSIARTVFGAVDATSPSYQEGISYAGLCFSLYNGVALAMAFALMWLVNKYSPKTIHTVCLVCGGIGLFSIGYIEQKEMLLLAMAGVGIAWASILAMPYALLAGCLPEEKMGVYMGVFNLFIVIPQVIIALTSGFLLTHVLGGTQVGVVMFGGACMIIAATLVRHVEY